MYTDTHTHTRAYANHAYMHVCVRLTNTIIKYKKQWEHFCWGCVLDGNSDSKDTHRVVAFGCELD